MANDESDLGSLTSAEFRRFDSGAAIIDFDLQVYAELAVLAAAHRLTGRAHVHFERMSENGLRCRVVPRSTLSGSSDLAGDLANAVLDEMLRTEIRRRTEPIRQVLIAQAFSKTDLLRPDLESADPQADPLGIAEPDAREG